MTNSNDDTQKNGETTTICKIGLNAKILNTTQFVDGEILPVIRIEQPAGNLSIIDNCSNGGHVLISLDTLKDIISNTLFGLDFDVEGRDLNVLEDEFEQAQIFIKESKN